MKTQPMWIVRLSRAALVLVIAAWAPAALAQMLATVTAGVHLRAGPDIFFPSVMILPPGAAVQVFGCEQGFNWCDVQFGLNRGWVDAAFLQAPGPRGGCCFGRRRAREVARNPNHLNVVRQRGWKPSGGDERVPTRRFNSVSKQAH